MQARKARPTARTLKIGWTTVCSFLTVSEHILFYSRAKQGKYPHKLALSFAYLMETLV